MPRYRLHLEVAYEVDINENDLPSLRQARPIDAGILMWKYGRIEPVSFYADTWETPPVDPSPQTPEVDQ